MELVNQEAVEIFGSAKFFSRQTLVIGYAYLACSQPIKARGEHVAQKFDRIVGALSQFRDVEKHSLQPRRLSRQPPAS